MIIMRSIKRLCRAIEQFDDVVIEDNPQAHYDFSKYSLEELRAKGQELWERSRQQDPDGYSKFNEWLESKSLDDLIKLYSELVARDFDLSACS